MLVKRFTKALRVLAETCALPAIVLTLRHHSYRPLIIASILGVFVYFGRLAFQFDLFRHHALSETASLEVLHKTHFLVRKDQGNLIAPGRRNAFQPETKIVQAIPRKPAAAPLVTLKSFLNRGWPGLVIVNTICDPPSLVSRLFLAHESGHGSIAGYFNEIVTHHPVFNCLVSYIPFIFFCVPRRWIVVGLLALAESFFSAGRYKSEVIADTFALQAIADDNGVPTAQHAERLLRTKLMRTLAASKDFNEELETKARLQNLDVIKQLLPQPRAMVMATEKLIVSLGLLYAAPRIAACVLVVAICQLPAPREMILSLALMIISLVYCGVHYSMYDVATRTLIEHFAYRTLDESEFVDPEVRAVS